MFQLFPTPIIGINTNAYTYIIRLSVEKLHSRISAMTNLPLIFKAVVEFNDLTTRLVRATTPLEARTIGK